VKTLELESVSPEVRRAAHLARGDVLVLTEKGKPTFAIVGLKDAMALEALALGRNAEFMAYLDDVSARTKKGDRHSLKEIREDLGLNHPPRPPKRRKRG
jgi:bifunctional DNA-binding transcriptional regulator/antitoxin component of YhaV-PrlF toxin-antitoxin module